jgi:hypothetical protein
MELERQEGLKHGHDRESTDDNEGAREQHIRATSNISERTAEVGIRCQLEGLHTIRVCITSKK